MIQFLGASQLWKLDGKTLINKANFWSSKDDWIFEPNDDKVYIKNLSKDKVLVFKNDEVYEENLVANDVEQMWLRLEDHEGYFSLQKESSRKLLTATPVHRLEVKGMYRVSHST